MPRHAWLKILRPESQELLLVPCMGLGFRVPGVWAEEPETLKPENILRAPDAASLTPEHPLTRQKKNKRNPLTPLNPKPLQPPKTLRP